MDTIYVSRNSWRITATTFARKKHARKGSATGMRNIANPKHKHPSSALVFNTARQLIYRSSGKERDAAARRNEKYIERIRVTLPSP